MGLLPMIDCKEAARLVSEGLDRDLPFFKRIALRVHLKMCKLCAFYQDQLKGLQQVFQKYSQSMDTMVLDEESLSDDSRQKMKSVIKSHSD